MFFFLLHINMFLLYPVETDSMRFGWLKYGMKAFLLVPFQKIFCIETARRSLKCY